MTETGVPLDFEPRWHEMFDREYERVRTTVEATPTVTQESLDRDAKAHAKLSLIWKLLPEGWYPDRDICERVERLAAASFRERED